MTFLLSVPGSFSRHVHAGNSQHVLTSILEYSKERNWALRDWCSAATDWGSSTEGHWFMWPAAVGNKAALKSVSQWFKSVWGLLVFNFSSELGFLVGFCWFVWLTCVRNPYTLSKISLLWPSLSPLFSCFTLFSAYCSFNHTSLMKYLYKWLCPNGILIRLRIPSLYGELWG